MSAAREIAAGLIEADEKLTQDELFELFGGTIPMSAVNFLLFGPTSEGLTMPEVRKRIREMAAEHRAKSASNPQIEAEARRLEEALYVLVNNERIRNKGQSLHDWIADRLKDAKWQAIIAALSPQPASENDAALQEKLLAKGPKRKYTNHEPYLGLHNPDGSEAAARIAILKVEINELQIACVDKYNKWAAVTAENARLREALTEIGREQSAKTAHAAADRFQAIARAALGDGK